MTKASSAGRTETLRTQLLGFGLQLLKTSEAFALEEPRNVEGLLGSCAFLGNHGVLREEISGATVK